MSQFNSPAVPPTEFDELPAELPKWPKVVGIISIVWGGFWILCGGCGIAGAFIGPAMAPPEMRDQMPPNMMSVGQIAGAVGGILMDVLLIVAGAVTIGRKPLGRVLHLVYGGLALPMMAIGFYFQLQQQAAMQQWVRDNPDSQFAKQMQAGGAIGEVVGYAIMGFACLYPLFVLFWFGVVKRRPQDMGTVPADDVI